MLVLVAFGCFSLSHASESRKSERLLNVIFFESYLTPSVRDGRAFDKYDWPTPDFPSVLSKLIALSGYQVIDVPSSFQFPANPMFVDIYTFRFVETRVNRKRSFSRRNDITLLDMQVPG